jgi:hypothetical protein
MVGTRELGMPRFIPAKGVVVAAALALLAGAARPALGQTGMEIGLHGWRSDMSISMRSDKNGLAGTTVSDGALGMDTSQLLLNPYARFGAIGNALSVDYWWNKYEGSGILSETVNFRGVTFAAGTPVNSSLDCKMLSLYWLVSLTSSAPGTSTSVGPVIGFKYGRLDSHLDSDTLSAKASMTIPVPVAGFEARFGLGEGVQIGGMIDYFNTPWNYFGADARIFEYQFDVGYKSSSLYAGVGYRYSKQDVTSDVGKDDEIRFNMNIKGWFAAAALSF